ncbi:hypothetical protein [uncultured Methanobrevibacter sp.]|uniref:hypothetical protein n=1 Tax=uncultured Methanobrevibacter sp. TaxID=253161 RepID=UPI0025E9DC33|nr:hypothetical protein [uncultured Methanobrevibacter sp.]
MKSNSLKLIEDVVGNFAKLASVEISEDSIYLEFIDVELGVPKNDDDLTLSMRFAKNSFLTVFYDNIWDIDFVSHFNYRNHFLQEDVLLDVRKIRFLDFEYLNTFFYNYSKQKDFTLDKEFDVHNIRCDFFCLIEFGDIAIAVGGNEMDFFTPTQRLDDGLLKELSNQWMMYYLTYHQKRNIIKDPMCENHPFNR